MAQMKAKTRFLKSGNFINKGDIFTVPESAVFEYETRDLAKRYTATENKAEEPRELQDMTVPQLKELAAAKGIDGYNTMKKAELLAALQ